VLLKNNIATADKMNNTGTLRLFTESRTLMTPGGSYALLGAQVWEDSTIAKKLRKAGVVILGKANMSQWANWRSENSSAGWSAYGGQTVGAFYENQNPSGR
jgi:amidase